MVARGTLRTAYAVTILALLLIAASQAGAWDQQYRYPLKVRVSDVDAVDARGRTAAGVAARDTRPEWDVAAGQARREILCPKRGFALALGMRPYFSNLVGTSKVASKAGEGTFLSLNGHLRLPPDRTLWEFYSYLRMWDKITGRFEYLPWSWTGGGHIPTEGNFAGLQLKKDDNLTSDLSLTSIVLGADYDVSFGRDLVFGPNGDFWIIKWSERVAKDSGDAMDFTQTILQPAIGAHIRYEPSNTGYFSWFKPFMEGRFSWMSFAGLGLSTWDFGAGIAPPVSRNVDAGFKIGYKQWRLDGSRGRLFADMGVEGLYLDFSLQF
jgi:hypothetical protein